MEAMNTRERDALVVKLELELARHVPEYIGPIVAVRQARDLGSALIKAVDSATNGNGQSRQQKVMPRRQSRAPIKLTQPAPVVRSFDPEKARMRAAEAM